MDDIFFPSISILEKIVRPAVVYIFLVIAFRVMGKREVGQFTPFDLIVLLTISNVLQNAMIGNDNSLLGGIIGAATIFALNRLLNSLAAHFPRAVYWLQGKPAVLIKDGKLHRDIMRREMITFAEIHAALRKHGIDDIAAVKLATLELDGQISVITRESDASPTHSHTHASHSSG